MSEGSALLKAAALARTSSRDRRSRASSREIAAVAAMQHARRAAGSSRDRLQAGRREAAAEPSQEWIASAAAAQPASEASEASIARQRAAFDALVATLDAGVSGAEAKLAELGRLVGETDGAAGQMVRDTGPALVDALLRVREAASQAASWWR